MIDLLTNLAQIFEQNSHLWISFCALIGLLIGSFCNVVIYRLPEQLFSEWRVECRDILKVKTEPEDNEPAKTFNIAVPASHCPQCKHPVGLLENIPLFSFIWQKGRCKHCSVAISYQYPLVELLCCVMSGLVAWELGYSLEAGLVLLLTWGLICASMIDLKHQLLLDILIYPMLWLGLICSTYGIFIDSESSIIGAATGYLVLWSVFHVYRLITKKEAMGHGDFKLLAVFGAWIGWQSLPIIIVISSLFGGIVGGLWVLFKKLDINQAMPFGPYIALTGWSYLLWGKELNFYLLSS
jgi:leader peptidase (prepilin peptidase) / N-methyltransferase